MTANILERGRTALNELSDDQLPTVVRWLELLAKAKGNPDAEPEELWLLATGELEKMDSEIKDAEPIDDWRKYLDQL
jgi:hypothetical protein